MRFTANDFTALMTVAGRGTKGNLPKDPQQPLSTASGAVFTGSYSSRQSYPPSPTECSCPNRTENQIKPQINFEARMHPENLHLAAAQSKPERMEVPPAARLFSSVLVAAFGLVTTVATSTTTSAQAPQAKMPHLVRSGDASERVDLIVDGSPFLILGGQAHNSSASNVRDAEKVYEALDYLHANTAEMPISWNLIELQPGKFDFTLVDSLIQRARQHHLRLVLLWFGTAKNGTFSYVPDWVKQDRGKYVRARDQDGHEMNTLSPLGAAALQADQHAFSALMRHIREFDKSEHTVILMQVENEIGLIRTDRDYSPEANRLFAEPVPAELLSYLSRHQRTLRPAMQNALQQKGNKTRGAWSDVFGDLAAEAFSAWCISRYVDGVAAAGKAEYPLPYYINVTLMNTGSARAGAWPSGGSTANVIDIWKATAPHIDIIAPDIYRVDFPEMVDIYDRADNPLFVPETGFAPYYAPYVFTTLAGHNGLGFAPFGVDGESRPQEINDGYNEVAGALRKQAASSALASVEENYRVLRPLLPLIASKRYQNSLFPIVLNFYRHEAVAIPVGDALSAVVHFDEIFSANTSSHRAGGIIIKLAPDRLVIAGHGFHINFAELKGALRDAEILSIEEGTFDGERWICERVLNGDEETVTLPASQSRILMVHLNRK